MIPHLNVRDRRTFTGSASVHSHALEGKEEVERNLITGTCPETHLDARDMRMERETGIEPATSSLGSWRSTAELLPLDNARLPFRCFQDNVLQGNAG